MQREPDIFPADPTGDALWEMQQNGDDLNKQREVEFTVVFENEEDALKFGETLLINRQKINKMFYDFVNFLDFHRCLK